MIGDIADRTPGASKHDILNAVGSDSRVGKKCATLAAQSAAANCDVWLQVPAPWLRIWRSLLPS